MKNSERPFPTIQRGKIQVVYGKSQWKITQGGKECAPFKAVGRDSVEEGYTILLRNWLKKRKKRLGTRGLIFFYDRYRKKAKLHTHDIDNCPCQQHRPEGKYPGLRNDRVKRSGLSGQ